MVREGRARLAGFATFVDARGPPMYSDVANIGTFGITANGSDPRRCPVPVFFVRMTSSYKTLASPFLTSITMSEESHNTRTTGTSSSHGAGDFGNRLGESIK
jgi:hypothetical protein